MPVRWGIIGCGDVARKRVAGAIQNEPRSELVSVCRRDQTKLDEFVAEFSVPRGTTSAEELIASPDIDAVYIATPVSLHRLQTIAAAQAGKHVLVEKPMAMSTAECDEMIATCREHNVKLGVAFYRPFYPVIRRMRELVETGGIGSVLSVSAVTATPFAINPDEDGYWRVIPELGGGGALMDIGSHRIDLFLTLFGPIVGAGPDGNSSGVKAFCGTVAADYDSDDLAHVIVQFESGVHGSLQCYFGSIVDPDEFAILGTKGRLVSRPLNGGELRIEKGSETSVEQHPPSVNFNTPLIADFVTAILEDRTPSVPGEQGRDVNRVMELAYAAARC
ncbi:MAG: Gfo/Idh/MocA family oxidoreductase [Planctomycetota bacterium]|nr:Gfo/Idh/MocA family oxidoreductase [Planctomycetota bacterium]MDA1250211.1 Gfo/Idh/MocA family oxidoreductase [Planctomycetota bacterium]